MWPVSNFRTAITKALVEQVTYGPAATASFFFIMSLLEYKTVEESKQELYDKFFPTIKVSVVLHVTSALDKVATKTRSFATIHDESQIFDDR